MGARFSRTSGIPPRFRRSVMGPLAAVCGGAEAKAGSEALRQVADGCVEVARAAWAVDTVGSVRCDGESMGP